METGIYEILNTANNKWYRGQTIDDFDTRWSRHKRALNSGTHVNKHLQRAWNKYGQEAFKFTILSRCAPDFCDELEDYWIGEDYNNPAISYNKKAGGGSSAAMSEETKNKISAAKKGKSHPLYGKKGFDHPKAKPFTCTFPDGHVDRWGSTCEAAKAYGVDDHTISRYLNGKSTPNRNKRTAHLKDTIWQYL